MPRLIALLAVAALGAPRMLARAKVALSCTAPVGQRARRHLAVHRRHAPPFMTRSPRP